MSRRSEFLVAALVHCYTALGGLLALFAVIFINLGDFRTTFLLLFAATLVDYTDGTMARHLNVAKIIPWVDGEKLDSVIDFTTNALTPALLISKADILPKPTIIWVSCMLIAALYRYSKGRHNAQLRKAGLFHGLPILWVFFMFYAFHYKLPNHVWVCILLIMTVLAFSPIAHIHVAKSRRFRSSHAVGLSLWWLAYLVVTQNLSANPELWLSLSLIYPVYYLLTSWLIYVDFLRRRKAQAFTCTK